VSLSGPDTLDLAGVLTPGPKLTALTGNSPQFRDGFPVASLRSVVQWFVTDLDTATQWEARKALVRPASLA
jgi:ATP-dependent helicase Lhr and Lhr-like helicase